MGCWSAPARTLLYTGVGKVNAAAALARRLAEIRCTGRTTAAGGESGDCGQPLLAAHTLVACDRFAQRDMDVSGLDSARRHAVRRHAAGIQFPRVFTAAAVRAVLHGGFIRHART